MIIHIGSFVELMIGSSVGSLTMSQTYDGLVDCAQGDEYCGLASEATREKLRLWIGNLTSFHHAQKTRNVVKRKKLC